MNRHNPEELRLDARDNLRALHSIQRKVFVKMAVLAAMPLLLPLLRLLFR